MGNLTTTLSKKKLLKARAGEKNLPAIAGMAFGNGAVDSNGNQLEPQDDNTLYNELIRKPITDIKEVGETTYRYESCLLEEDIPNTFINEIALYDTEGDIIAKKTFLNKGKDSDLEIAMYADDKIL